MKPSIFPGLTRQDAWERLPASVRVQVTANELPPIVDFVSFGVDNKDVVRRSQAQSAVEGLGGHGVLLVTGPNFTAEALEVFRVVGARVVSLGDYYWTEGSLDAL